MARYNVPSNVGKVRVVMALGGKFAVWNGKIGKHEFRIFVRTKKQATEVARLINNKQHDGTIDVFS